MKILSLRLKNLNSLKGEWKIDFTAEPFASNGLFAITGPTGAGKTTLLDAIMNKLLGERVMDRMRLGNSLWVNFNWDSYRDRVTGKEY